MSYRSPALLCLVALTLAFGACSDDDDSEDGAAPPSTSTTEAPDATEPAVGTPVDCAASPGETVTVEIPEFVFEPEAVEVNACDEVVWSNTHNQAHTSSGGDWNTNSIAPGEQSDPVLFDTAGELTYMCAFHPFMTGTVTVS